MRSRGRRTAAPALGLVALCACTTPARPREIGVHVAGAANDSARMRFTVTVVGTLELGIRSTVMAMRPDKSLLLSTPADIVVNKGAGSAVIALADSGSALRVTPLDPADSAKATATARAVRLTRQENDRHLTAQAVPPNTP